MFVAEPLLRETAVFIRESAACKLKTVKMETVMYLGMLHRLFFLGYVCLPVVVMGCWGYKKNKMPSASQQKAFLNRY